MAEKSSNNEPKSILHRVDEFIKKEAIRINNLELEAVRDKDGKVIAWYWVDKSKKGV